MRFVVLAERWGDKLCELVEADSLVGAEREAKRQWGSRVGSVFASPLSGKTLRASGHSVELREEAAEREAEERLAKLYESRGYPQATAQKMASYVPTHQRMYGGSMSMVLSGLSAGHRGPLAERGGASGDAPGALHKSGASGAENRSGGRETDLDEAERDLEALYIRSGYAPEVARRMARAW